MHDARLLTAGEGEIHCKKTKADREREKKNIDTSNYIKIKCDIDKSLSE